VRGLVQQGHVTVAGAQCDDPAAEFEPVEGQRFTVQGTDWEYHEKAYLMLHKPAGYECSQKPSAYRAFTRCCLRRFAGAAGRPVEVLGRSGDEPAAAFVDQNFLIQ